MHIRFSNFEVNKEDELTGYYDFKSENEIATFELIKKWKEGAQTFTFQSSGSTGVPKKIQASRKQLEASALRTLAYFDIKEGVILNCLFAKHIGGAMQIVRALVGNLDLIVLEPSKNPFKGNFIPWNKISLLSLVPYQLNDLLEFYIPELLKCKSILLGGSPANPKLKRLCKENNLTNVYETYGMTETLSHVAVKNSIADDSFHALSGVSFFLNKDNTLVIDDEKLGLKRLETNDLVRLNSKGSFLFLGRKDNVINSGGLKFYPEVIEKKISSLTPFNYIIFPKKDESLGESINLLIESSIPVMDLDLIKTSRLLEKYEMPKNIFFLEKFIYTESKKIKRIETVNLFLSKGILEQNL